MAAITKIATPSLASVEPQQSDQFRGICAEDVAAFDALYISGVNSDGMPLFTRAIGTAVNAAAKVVCYAAAARKSGEAITGYKDVVVRYGSGLTPGPVFLGTAAGGLDTAATTGGTAPIGHIIDATRIYLRMSHY